MARRRRQAAQPVARLPEFYKESRGQAGPGYVYKASYCHVLCGYPELISVKALKDGFEMADDGLLQMTRQGKSKLFYIEGPAGQVKAVFRLAVDWRKIRAEGGRP